jgi:heme exporter protein CcmD
MIFDDKYAVYVISAYAATILILGGMVWATIAANARARRALAKLEEERGR